MRNYKLGFISDNDIYEHVKCTVESYRRNITLEEFNVNIVDPIKLTFDSKVYGKTIEQVIADECFRQMDKSNGNKIGYFHQNIFKYAGNGWVVPNEGFDVENPRLHIYVEMRSKTAHTVALTREVIREHLSVYFKYLDNDYQDLKKILGIDPLKITMLPLGAFKKYYSEGHDALRRINPPAHEKLAFMRCCGLPFTGGVY